VHAAHAPELVRAPGRFLQLLALRLAAAEALLDPQEHRGVDGLRAGVAAPQSPGHRGEEEQRVGADDQQCGQVDEVLRVQHQAEQVEALGLQVEQHRLALAQLGRPLQPGQTVEHRLREEHEEPAPALEQAVNLARMDALALLVEADRLARCAQWALTGSCCRVA
jgi:hypothetical protein